MSSVASVDPTGSACYPEQPPPRDPPSWQPVGANGNQLHSQRLEQPPAGYARNGSGRASRSAILRALHTLRRSESSLPALAAPMAESEQPWYEEYLHK